MIGRRVGATTDGCVYSLIARVELSTWKSLVSGAIDGRQAFLDSHEAGLSGTVETDGVSNVFDIDWYDQPDGHPRGLPAAGPVPHLRPGPAHRRPVAPVPGSASAEGPPEDVALPAGGSTQGAGVGPGGEQRPRDAGQDRARRASAEQPGRALGRTPLDTHAGGEDHAAESGQVERRTARGWRR